jgi:IS30 family transposase
MSRGVELSFAEREEISRLIVAGRSGREIAGLLGRHQSVVNREIRRGGGGEDYRAVASDRRAQCGRRRPKLRRVEADPRLLGQVNDGLRQKWSPSQISARLKRDFPDDDTMRVSHEQLYEALYVQARGQLKVELVGQLRRGGARRVSVDERRRVGEKKQQVIPSMVMITERPAEAADRAVPGHWEGDLIMGAANRSAIITLVERTSRFTVLCRLAYDHTATRVALQLSHAMDGLPERLKRSLTWDQGREMASHAKFTARTGIPVFFCDPHSPWQRPSNENMNGLIREYFPKGIELQDYSQNYLDAVARELNGRPRKVLDWQTPAEKLDEILGKAGGALTA